MKRNVVVLAYFSQCDPILNGTIKKADQVECVRVRVRVYVYVWW